MKEVYAESMVIVSSNYGAGMGKVSICNVDIDLRPLLGVWPGSQCF